MNLDGKKKIVGTCIGRTGLWESLRGDWVVGIYSVFVFKFVCSSCLFFLFVFRRGFDLIRRNK